MTMISNMGNTFQDIHQAYYANGEIKVPTDVELKKIQADTAAMELCGKLFITGSVVGLGLTYVVWKIPYVGAIMGLTTGVASIAAGVLGYDLTICANNCQEFGHRPINNSIMNVASSFLQGEKKSERDFQKNLIKAAVKGTIIAQAIFNYVAAHH